MIYIESYRRFYARFLFVFSDLTGYFGQEDDVYSGREALKVHFLGGRSNHVTSLSYRTNQGSI